MLVPDARNGTRCRPSSRVGQGAPGHHHENQDHNHDVLGVSDYGDEDGKIDDTSGHSLFSISYLRKCEYHSQADSTSVGGD